MKSILLAAAAAALLWMGQAGAGEADGSALASRVALPEPEVIKTFEGAGMRDVRPHVLTPAERTRVEAALAGLPALHRRILAQKLRRLSFVDGIPGQGTGLTSRVDEGGRFDITLRATLFDESLSQFLTAKERRLFAPDGSGRSVTVEASGADALFYVLLHEASHVVDSTLGLSTKQGGAYTAGIWEDRTTLSPGLAASPAAATSFRRRPPLPIGQAGAVYDALAKTPFVSLYATAAAPEDLAELMTWRDIARRRQGSLAITVSDAAGKPLARYEPLSFPAVQARMARVDELLRDSS